MRTEMNTHLELVDAELWKRSGSAGHLESNGHAGRGPAKCGDMAVGRARAAEGARGEKRAPGPGAHLGERAGLVLAANLSLVDTHVLRNAYTAMRK